MLPRRHFRVVSYLIMGLTLTILILTVVSGCKLWNLRPTANFEVSPNPRPGIPVTFTNTSTDPNGFEDLTQFVWDLGDGTIADTFNVSHIYEEAGTYTVKLTVYDASGEADTCQQKIDVRSRIFGLPKEFAVGKSVIHTSNGQIIPVYDRYDYSESEHAWQVVYYAEPYMYGQFRLHAHDIIFWVKVPFVKGLSQAVLLSLYWELQSSDGKILKTYQHPNKYALGDLSRVAGVDAIMSYWDQMAESNAVLPDGSYKVRLYLTDELSGEVFVWDFPFTVTTVIISTR